MSSMVPNILQSLTSQQHIACIKCKASNYDATKAYNFVHITSVLKQQLQVNLHFFFKYLTTILSPFLFFQIPSLLTFFSNSPPCPDKLLLSPLHTFSMSSTTCYIFSHHVVLLGQLSTTSPALQQNYHKRLHYS